jgi:hypothetical protein
MLSPRNRLRDNHTCGMQTMTVTVSKCIVVSQLRELGGWKTARHSGATDQNIVEWNMDQLRDEPNSPHENKAHANSLA